MLKDILPSKGNSISVILAGNPFTITDHGGLFYIFGPDSHITVDKNDRDDQGNVVVTVDCTNGELITQNKQYPIYTDCRLPIYLSDIFNRGENYIEAFNRESILKNNGFVIVTAAMRRRIKGETPILKIGNDIFDIDYSIEKAVFKGARSSDGIPFESFVSSVDNPNILENYYDTVERKLIKFDKRSLIDLPPNVVQISHPDFRQIDPIGYARSINVPDTSFLGGCQMNQNQEAKVINLRDTWLPFIINENRRLNGLPIKKFDTSSKKFKQNI